MLTEDFSGEQSFRLRLEQIVHGMDEEKYVSQIKTGFVCKGTDENALDWTSMDLTILFP